MKHENVFYSKDKNLLDAALRYLNSDEFIGPFNFGLSQDTPLGWSPFEDYSLMFGYLNHFPLKTNEMLDDDSLPFKNFYLPEQWYEIRIEILLKEVTSSMTNYLSLDSTILTPKEWYEIQSLKILPLIYTRFHFLRLLRAIYYYGLKEEYSIQDNFEFLISQCSLNDYSKKTAIRFLSLIYNRCKNLESSLFHDFIPINDGNEKIAVDISWISENHISAICDSLLLMQKVRNYHSVLDKETILERFECCPPWEVNPRTWTPENDYFLFKTISKIGFSSLVEFFIDPDSPLYEQSELLDELKTLRKIESINISPHKNVPISKYRFMFNYKSRVNRIKQLVSFLYCPHFEKQIFQHFQIFDCLTVLNEGLNEPNSKAPIGYFAFRVIYNKNTPFLISCTVGGTKSIPIFQLKLIGKKNLRVFDININKALNLFREALKEDQKMPKIPDEMSGSQFFGFENQIVSTLIK